MKTIKEIKKQIKPRVLNFQIDDKGTLFLESYETLTENEEVYNLIFEKLFSSKRLSVFVGSSDTVLDEKNFEGIDSIMKNSKQIDKDKVVETLIGYAKIP